MSLFSAIAKLRLSSHVVSISLVDSGCPDTYLNLPFPRKPKKELNNWRRMKTSQTEGQCNLDESTSLKPLSDWLIQYNYVISFHLSKTAKSQYILYPFFL